MTDENEIMLAGIQAFVDRASAEIKDPDISETRRRVLIIQLRELFQVLVHWRDNGG